jgi:hypothetical protein
MTCNKFLQNRPKNRDPTENDRPTCPLFFGGVFLEAPWGGVKEGGKRGGERGLFDAHTSGPVNGQFLRGGGFESPFEPLKKLVLLSKRGPM